MNSDTQQSNKKSVKKFILISTITVLILIIAISTVYAAVQLNSNTIYNGVYIGNTDVGNITVTEAKKTIDDNINKISATQLKFNCRDTSFEIPISELAFKADSEKLVKKAYKIGREKNIFKSLKTIISCSRQKYAVNFDFSFDEERLMLLINDSIQSFVIDSSPMTAEISNGKLYVTNASDGMGADSKRIISDVKNAMYDIEKCDIINIEITEKKQENLSPNEFFELYNRDAKDAVYTKTSDGHKIEPEIVGIKLNIDAVKKCLKSNENNTEPYEMPAEITYPKVTAQQLEDKYVNHIIASYTTSFADSSANRCANIALAASKINGYVINPGKRFSYNGVVGPRTAATGFKSAHVYVGTQVTDGIGGGICQVSSTLYNAVVMADLKIVSRTNHSMPVGYTPLGRDATVSYGTIDFVFENNKSYPVSIKASINGRQLTISIVGSETPDYTVEFATQYVKSIPYSTEKTDDSTLAEGQTKIISTGSNGSVVNSYRVYKRDGKEYDRKFEGKSTYSPVNAKVAVGTKKQDATPEPIAEPKEESDEPKIEPVTPTVPNEEATDNSEPSKQSVSDSEEASPTETVEAQP